MSLTVCPEVDDYCLSGYYMRILIMNISSCRIASSDRLVFPVSKATMKGIFIIVTSLRFWLSPLAKFAAPLQLARTRLARIRLVVETSLEKRLVFFCITVFCIFYSLIQNEANGAIQLVTVFTLYGLGHGWFLSGV